MSDEQPKKPRRRVKKAKGHGDHHGGAWKVAYADFVTAMMALFLVLWLVSQADQKLKNAIAQYFRSPGVFDTMQGGVLGGPKKVSKEPGDMTSKDEEQALFQTATMLRKAFATRPEFSKYKDQVRIEVTEEGLKIDILDKAERVSFPSGKAELTGEARGILAEIAQGICQLPNPLKIGGHTDRHVFPAGSTYTNWELSADRANAARRALEAACVRPEQIRRVVGYADTELLVPDDPFAPANRRISIVVMRTGGESTAARSESVGAEDQREDRSDHDAAKDSSARKTGENEPKIIAGSEPDAATRLDAVGSDKAARSASRLARTRLANEGATSVGTPDELPAGVKRTRGSLAPASHAPAAAAHGVEKTTAP